MNERLKELAMQAGLEVDESVLIGNIFDIYFPEGYHTEIIERFAELVRDDEREACAKLCEGRWAEGLNFEGCSAAIRARGEK
jgi:hypothetical protein